MNSLLTVAVLAGAAFAAWHSWLTYKSGGFAPRSPLYGRCPCGHAASWHADDSRGGAPRPGCQSKDVASGESDPYGYCPCPRTFAELEARAEVSA